MTIPNALRRAFGLCLVALTPSIAMASDPNATPRTMDEICLSSDFLLLGTVDGHSDPAKAMGTVSVTTTEVLLGAIRTRKVAKPFISWRYRTAPTGGEEPSLLCRFIPRVGDTLLVPLTTTTGDTLKTEACLDRLSFQGSYSRNPLGVRVDDIPRILNRVGDRLEIRRIHGVALDPIRESFK